MGLVEGDLVGFAGEKLGLAVGEIYEEEEGRDVSLVSQHSNNLDGVSASCAVVLLTVGLTVGEAVGPPDGLVVGLACARRENARSA